MAGEWHSSWQSNVSEWQQANRSNTLDAAWDYVYGPIAGQPGTDVSLSDLADGNISFIGHAHGRARGHDDYLDLRPGSSCSASLQPWPSALGISERDILHTEIFMVSDQFIEWPSQAPSLCLGGATIDSYTLAPHDTYAGHFTFSPQGGVLDSKALIGDTEPPPLANLVLRQLGSTPVALTEGDLSAIAAGHRVDLPWSFSYTEDTEAAKSSFGSAGHVIFSLSPPLEPSSPWSPDPITSRAALNGNLKRLLDKAAAWQKWQVMNAYSFTAAAAAVWAAPMAAEVPPAIVLGIVVGAAAYQYHKMADTDESAYHDPPAPDWRVVPAPLSPSQLTLSPGTAPPVRALVSNDQQIAAEAGALSSAIDRAGSAQSNHDSSAAAAQLAAARHFDLVLAALCTKQPALAAAAWQSLRNSLDWSKYLTATAWDDAVAAVDSDPPAPAALAVLGRYGFDSAELTTLRSELALASTPLPGLPTPEQLVTGGSDALAKMAPLLMQLARDVEVPQPTVPQLH